MYYIYILKSIKHKRFYIGSTDDFSRRLEEHNSGKTTSTRPYRPWELIYMEEWSTKSEACKREWHLKHPKGYLEKLGIVKKYGSIE